MKRIILLTTAALIAATSLSAAEQSAEAKVYSKDKFVRLRNGNKIYQEGEVTYHSIPDEFDGGKITLRDLDSTNPAVFKVKKAGMVRIAAVGGLVTNFKNEGWVEIGRISILRPDGEIIKDPIYILEKNFDIGDYSIPSHGNFGVRLLKKRS